MTAPKQSVSITISRLGDSKADADTATATTTLLNRDVRNHNDKIRQKIRYFQKQSPSVRIRSATTNICEGNIVTTMIVEK